MRDRVIQGQFDATQDDKVYIRGFDIQPSPVQELVESSQPVLEITIFSDNDQTGNQGTIVVTLMSHAGADSGFSGSLRPSGEAKGIWNDEWEAEQALSLFALAEELLDSKRLQPISNQ